MKPAQFVVLCVFGMVSWLAVSQAPTIDSGLLAKANVGDPAAEVSVGESYAQAAGAAQDPEIATDNWNKAAEWYIKAAAQSYIAAEIHLADCYSYGRGVPRDKTKAAEWYRKAAEQGDPGAQGTLAMLYTMGRACCKTTPLACFWSRSCRLRRHAQPGSLRNQPAERGHAHHSRSTCRRTTAPQEVEGRSSAS